MIKLLKTGKHDNIEPIMTVDEFGLAHCVWKIDDGFCHSKFNGVDWEYLGDSKIIDSIPLSGKVPQNGVTVSSEGVPYIVWGSSGDNAVFGSLSQVELSYWDSQWKNENESIFNEIWYGSSLTFYNDDIYVGSLIFRDNQHLFVMHKWTGIEFEELNTIEISQLSSEKKVVLKNVEGYIYCFWDNSGSGSYWIEHVIYNVSGNVFHSTVTKKILLTNDSVPLSGFDFISL